MKVFEGRAVYIPDLPQIETPEAEAIKKEALEREEYLYENKDIIIVAKDEETAEKQLKIFLAEENEGTFINCWEIVEITSASGELDENGVLHEIEIFEGFGKIIIDTRNKPHIGLFTGKAKYKGHREGESDNTAQEDHLLILESTTIGVIAKDRESAATKIKNFVMTYNPDTIPHLWDIENIINVKRENMTILQNIKSVMVLCVFFINVELFPPKPVVEFEIKVGKEPEDDE